MPQYSLTGSKYDSRVPGQYYDAADMERRKAAGKLSDLIYANPSRSQVSPMTRSMTDEGVAYDVEGLLSNVALRYGRQAAEQLAEAIPTMSPYELLQTRKILESSSREADAMSDRETQAYERAGMKYRQGQYQR